MYYTHVVSWPVFFRHYPLAFMWQVCVHRDRPGPGHQLARQRGILSTQLPGEFRVSVLGRRKVLVVYAVGVWGC